MSQAYLEIDEYLWFTEYQQGNINVSGLIFDDTILEGFSIFHDAYTLWIEQVEDGFNLEEGDFTIHGSGNRFNTTGIHWPIAFEGINFAEAYGAPLRVRNTVLNLTMTTPVVPARIANIHLDVLCSGWDIYWEDIDEQFMCHSTYANAVPYRLENIFESIWMDMEEPQPMPPITLSMFLDATDLVNMRHEVEQWYDFNSKCFEEFFVWDEYTWGWAHQVDDTTDFLEAIQEAIGKVANEYIYLGESSVIALKVKHAIDDRFFTYDTAEADRFYVVVAADTFSISDGQVSFVAIPGLVEEILSAVDTPTYPVIFGGLAVESLAFTDIAAFACELIIEEGLHMGDVELSRWVFGVLIECGFDVADIIS